jgi:hypothetical protein
MGTIEQGFLGGFNGKLGTAVGSKWKGIKGMICEQPVSKTKLYSYLNSAEAVSEFIGGMTDPLFKQSGEMLWVLKS